MVIHTHNLIQLLSSLLLLLSQGIQKLTNTDNTMELLSLLLLLLPWLSLNVFMYLATFG